MTRFALLSVTLSASLALAGWTQQGDGEASFDAKGNIGMKIHGVAKKLAVADDGKALTLTVKFDDISTDNTLRDSHLKEDTEATKYPDITLTVPLEGLKLDGGSGTAKGTFAMHGQSKAVSFKYSSRVKDGVTHVEGNADISLKDYGVKVRSYLGVTVKPEVSVAAKFSLKQ